MEKLINQVLNNLLLEFTVTTGIFGSETYVGQFDGIKDEVDYVISNKGYSWSPLNMAHIIKRSMEWMKC